MSNDLKAPAEAERPRLGIASALARFALIGVVLAAVAGAFAYLGGWFTPHELTPARFADGFLLRLDLGTHHVELAPMPVLRWNRSDEKIERLEQSQLARARLVPGICEFFAALVVHGVKAMRV